MGEIGNYESIINRFYANGDNLDNSVCLNCKLSCKGSNNSTYNSYYYYYYWHGVILDNICAKKPSKMISYNCRHL